MEQLHNFKSIDLHAKLSMSDNDFDTWLEELGLLHGKRTCAKCGGQTSIHVAKDHRYGSWRCTTKNCRAKIGFLCGTFFEGSHLSTKQIFHLSYLWAQQYEKIAQMEHETGIGHTSIVDWLNFLETCAPGTLFRIQSK